MANYRLRFSPLAGCKYNQVNSHFHCIREACQFSFLLKHQMTSHARKHMRRMLGKNFDRVPSQVGGAAEKMRTKKTRRSPRVNRGGSRRVHLRQAAPRPCNWQTVSEAALQLPPLLIKHRLRKKNKCDKYDCALRFVHGRGCLRLKFKC